VDQELELEALFDGEQKTAILLDTQMFLGDFISHKENFFTSKRFIAFLNLLNKTNAVVFIPEISLKEFRYNVSFDLKTAHKAFISSYKNAKIHNYSSELKQECENFSNNIQTKLDQRFAEVKQEIADLINTQAINILEHSYDDMKKTLLEDYFNDLPPFKLDIEEKVNKDKRKEHIPDSIIQNSIKRIYDDYDQIIFFCRDGRLRKSLEECHLENLFIYNDIKALTSRLNPVQIHSENQDQVKKELNLLFNKRNENIDNLFNEALFDFFNYREIYHSDISGENGIGSVCDIEHYTISEASSVEVLDDAIFEIEFDVALDLNIETNIYKADYWNQEGVFDSVEELNDHYFTVSEDIQINVKVSLTIDINNIPRDMFYKWNEIFSNDYLDEVELVFRFDPYDDLVQDPYR
jgi:hypothetical protein